VAERFPKVLEEQGTGGGSLPNVESFCSGGTVIKERPMRGKMQHEGKSKRPFIEAVSVIERKGTGETSRKGGGGGGGHLSNSTRVK